MAALSKPVRKVYYNITITALSVAVALIIGTVELISILTDKLSITHGPLAWLGNLDLNNVGFFIVGLFVLSFFLRIPDPETPSVIALLLSLAGVALALFSGWLGGELVNRLGIGVSDDANPDAPSSLD